jgi:hypothetical protein
MHLPPSLPCGANELHAQASTHGIAIAKAATARIRPMTSPGLKRTPALATIDCASDQWKIERMPSPRPPIVARCETCSASVNAATADRDEARAELEALGWLPCSRKGGKLAWLCPTHNPTKGPAPGGYRSTPGHRA